MKAVVVCTLVGLGVLGGGLRAQTSGAAALDRMLDLYVRDGLVYYAALKAERATLDRFVTEISEEPAGFSAWAPEAVPVKNCPLPPPSASPQAMAIELLGPMPKRLTTLGKNAKKYFKKSGELANIKNLKHWPLQDVLTAKYELPTGEAAALTELLSPMLHFDPSERASGALPACVGRGELDLPAVVWAEGGGEGPVRTKGAGSRPAEGRAVPPAFT